MKKPAVVLCILLCAGFTLSAAVNIKADDIATGEIASDADLGGIGLTIGTGHAEVAEEPVSSYSKALTISGDTAISIEGVAGETISLIGGTLDVAITAPDGTVENVSGVAGDDGTAIAEYAVNADGTYTIASSAGDPVSIYQITAE